MSTTSGNRENELGAIWLRESQAGNKYYYGRVTIDGVLTEFVMYKNDRKEAGSKQPDWRIYKSLPRNGQAPPPAPQAAAPQQQRAPAQPPPVSRPVPQRPQPAQPARPAPQRPAPAPAAAEPAAQPTESSSRTL